MFSAGVAFRERTFHEINNADWINNADLWLLFCRQTEQVVKQRVESRVAGDLRRNAINLSSDRGPGVIVDTLTLEDRAPVDFV